MKDTEGKNTFLELLIKTYDNKISSEEVRVLNEFIKTDDEAANLYAEFFDVVSGLVDLNRIELPFEDSDPSGFDTWINLLAQDEESAPAIEIPKEEPEEELTQKAEDIPHNNSKLSLFPVIFSVAALLFIVLFIYLVPVPTNIEEVATVQDSINAQGSSNLPIMPGSRISTDPEPIQLSKGVVKFITDDNVEVLLQGPSEFTFLSSSEINLNYGKLFARVSEQGLGFAVATPNSKIVDLGTEFGVLSHINGDTEVHMYKGKANLFAGSKKANKTSQLITSGLAKKVLHTSSNVKEIALEEKAVVRNINSKAGLIWNGQAINLADVIGGGDGFGGGALYKGVDVITGDVVTELLDNETRFGSKGYITVPDNVYIDGVFSPGLDSDGTKIASEIPQKIHFSETSGGLWGYIFNGAIHEGTTTPRHSLQLNGTVFGTDENPAIAIHSNQGITFDLSRIRKDIPGLKIDRFCSLIGISETVTSSLEKEKFRSFEDFPEIKKVFDVMSSKVEFWVFLDGRQVFHKEISSAAGANTLQIPITARDRFLTLAVTESDDTTAYDWALFGRPELVVDYE